jgi:mRNA-decapping enzyme subunit 2
MSGLNRFSSVPFKNGGLPPQELLDDLCSRLVLNVPKEDQQSFERILFLVENAHWFYEDNSVEKNPSLKSFTLKEFTSLSIFFLYKIYRFFNLSIFFLFLRFFFSFLNKMQCLTVVMF